MALTLPATKWGAALDFLSYQDARTTLRVNKIFRKEVVQHIQVLSTSNPSELDVPSARRFPNVTHVNICITTNKALRDAKLCRKSVTRIVPFLQAFPHLRQVDLQHHPELFLLVIQKGEQHARYCEMIDHLIGAFKSRALSRLHGVRSSILSSHFSHVICEKCFSRGAECDTCTAFCQTFPFAEVVRFGNFGCLNFWERIDLIKAQSGGIAYLKKTCLTVILHWLRCQRTGHNIFVPSNALPREEGAPLGAGFTFVSVINFSDLNVPRVRAFMNECDFDPLELSKMDLLEALSVPLGGSVDRSRPYVILQSKFDALVEFGFKIEKGDFIGGVYASFPTCMHYSV